MNTPNCPKCGQPMTGGAPHGPWPVQYECRRCGEYVIPPSIPSALRAAVGYTLDMFGQRIPTTSNGRLDGGTETIAERLAAVGGVCAERMLRDAIASPPPESPDAHAILTALVTWYKQSVGGNGPSMYSLFDDERTWWEVLNGYFLRSTGHAVWEGGVA